MFDLIFIKKYPDYWKDYSAHFKQREQKKMDTVRFVVFDTETTGLNIQKDRVLSIGAVGVTNNTIDVSDNFEVYLDQAIFNPETVKIHGILMSGHIDKIEEEEAIISFLKFIGDSILVAHHAAFDIAMINASLLRMRLPKLKNKVLDTGVLFKKTKLLENKDSNISLDRLCEIFRLKKHDRHTASGDAYLTALIFLKILANLKKKGRLSLKSLFFNSDRRGLL